MTRSRWLVGSALAIGAALLTVLASPDVDLWPLAYVALVPLLWAVDSATDRRGYAPTLRRALWCGWLAGLAANLGGFTWITSLLARHAGLPMPLAVLGLVLLAAGHGLVFLLFALAVHRVRRISAERLGAPLPMVAVAPTALVTAELLIPQVFPWQFAISQAWVSPVVQVADLTGPLGVSALLAATAGGLYDLLQAGPWRRRLACAGAAVTLLGLVLCYGWVRIAAIDARRAQAPTARVGLVQANFALDRRGRSPDLTPTQALGELQRVSAELEARGAELLVWPEAAYPYALPHDLGSDLASDSPYRVRRGFRAPLVLGAITRTQDPNDYPYNSVFLLDRDDRVRARYDKSSLVLFSEYIPGVEAIPALREILPRGSGHYSRGAGPVMLPVTLSEIGSEADVGGAERGYRLAALICYEDTLSHAGRAVAGHHPHLLVNLTNDTWFGDTAEPWQHLALAVYRAVELRADLVRAVNTGPSGMIDAAGRVRHTTYVIDPATDPRPAEGVVVEVALMEAGYGLYARYGDLFGYACALFIGLACLLWPRLRPRAAGRSARPA
ncbi:apolipoprotein N-acyltransferase [Haliangium sp.]|uniref:apolipoprotein N-acyltransferase n=1 Tax=Haliangium sp. TaxID=2663208 RepID=UPI003D0BA181